MRLKVKTEETENSRSFGIVETFRVTEGYGRKSIEGVAVLDIALGTLSETFFYFGGTFTGVEEASFDLGEGDTSIGLARYMKARKPVHSLFGNNKPIVQFGATRTADGKVSSYVAVLKPIRSLVSEDTIIVSRLKNSPEFTAGMHSQLMQILDNVTTREEYYAARQSIYDGQRELMLERAS